MTKICILTAAPDYFEDLGPACAAYRRLLGDDIAFRHWTDPGDLTGFGLVLPLLVWGYQRDCPRWFALLNQLEQQQIKIANPVSVLRWNSNKSYLLELEKAGIAIVPTLISAALTANDIAQAVQTFESDHLVVKPPISGGADGTYRLQNGDPLPESIAGKEMLIQPFQPAIAEEGEYSLFYFGGTFSHAILKRPAKGDFRVQEFLGGSESGADCPAGAQELAVQARQAAEQILGTETLLYARVDMLRDAEGRFRLMELELIEPSLFFEHAADGGAMFARAVEAQRCRANDKKTSKSVGLAGDGDEIHAIIGVEDEFGVKLDDDDAPNWHTAGDVFTSLRKVLPANEVDRPENWTRFARALCAETGVDPHSIGPKSPLLSETSFWRQIADLNAGLWIGILVAIVAVTLFAYLS